MTTCLKNLYPESLTTIRKYIDDRNTIFVFPSEITARFWLKKSFQFTRKKTLPAKRFLSWDQFKESAFIYPGDLRPVNQAIRSLYTCHMLEENMQKKFFKYIIRPEYSENSKAFQKTIKKILPSLHQITKLEPLWPESSRAKLEDLQFLWLSYSRFLEKTGLFEPNSKTPHLKLKGYRYFIFYPEVIEDYVNFKIILSLHPEIEVVHVNSEGTVACSESPEILAFENSIKEIKWVFHKIAGLLDRGSVDPEQIFITVSELNQIEDYIRREADLYEIPLQIHRGKPLVLYPEARLFGQIRDCVESNFSLDSLKALLLNHALPWKNPRQCRELIRLGIDYKVFKNYGSDQWLNALRKCGRCRSHPEISISDLNTFYNKLKKHLLKIYGLKDFKLIKESLIDFTYTFLTTSDWTEEQLKVFQYSLKSLDELIEASKITGLSLQFPFLMWLEYLDEKIYVQKDSSPGIPVFPYRVTTGIYPDYHFIINASQRGTAHIVKHYPFMSIHEEEKVEDPEFNLSHHHLKLYSKARVNAYFSYSRRSFSDTHLPPAFFVSHGNIHLFSESEFKKLESRDLYRLERLYWGGKSVPPQILPVQKEGFLSSINTILAPKHIDFTQSAIQSRDLIKRIRKIFLELDSFLRITPTALELFQGCPFHFLLEYVLNLTEDSYKPVMLDPMEIGMLMHRVFQRFYERIIKSEKKLELKNLDHYQEQIRDDVYSVLREYEMCRPVPIPPVWNELERKSEELAAFQIETEIKEMPEEEIMFTEKRLKVSWPEEKICLVGKIDLISKSDDLYTLIDYKKNKLPGRNSILGPEPTSFQMPFYIYLMNENGMEVGRAAYYSMERKRFIYIINPDKSAMAHDEEIACSIEGLKMRIVQMASGIRNGRYLGLSLTKKEACRYCACHGICRTKYILGP